MRFADQAERDKLYEQTMLLECEKAFTLAFEKAPEVIKAARDSYAKVLGKDSDEYKEADKFYKRVKRKPPKRVVDMVKGLNVEQAIHARLKELGCFQSE